MVGRQGLGDNMDANASGKSKRAKKARRDWLAFDRSDYIATKVLLAIAVVGSVLFELVGPVVDAVRNAPLAVSYTTKVASGIQLPRGATHDGDVTMQLLLKDTTLGERLIQAVPGMLDAAVTITVALLLFQLLRTTQAADPFIRPNVRRLNTIALVVGLGWTMSQLAQGVADSAMYGSGRVPAPSTMFFTMTFSPLPLVAMMVIALIGETFRRGVALREDVDGLV
jgi:Protein of unknown function (DUF2975)